MFGFPDDIDFSQRWKRFANRIEIEDPCSSAADKDDLCAGEASKTEAETSGICIDHFEEKYIKRGEKRVDLIYNANPVPTIHTSKKILSQPSVIPSLTIPRKAPTKRKYEHPLLDQAEKFIKLDKISCLEDLNNSFSPEGYSFQKIDDDRVLFTKISFENGGPSMSSITVDRNLHVKLHNKGNPIPLPEWFRKCSCKLTSVSMLDNFSSHIENVMETMGRDVLSELNSLRYYQAQGRPSYSNEMLKFALMQRYTSRQAYSMLLEEFPLPSLSYLKTLSQGGVDPIKALSY